MGVDYTNVLKFLYYKSDEAELECLCSHIHDGVKANPGASADVVFRRLMDTAPIDSVFYNSYCTTKEKSESMTEMGLFVVVASYVIASGLEIYYA